MRSVKKILIDAKWLHKGPPSGKVVVKSQIKELKQFLDDFEITLLIDINDPHEISYIEQGFQVLKIPNFSLFSNFLIFPILHFYKKFDAGLFQNSVPIYFRGMSFMFVHDIIFKSHPQFFTKFELLIFQLINWSFSFSDSIVTISNNEKNRILQYGYGNANTTHVVYNGVDHLSWNVDEIKNETHKNDNLPENYVLYVGRINDRKNVKNAIEAMKYVNSGIELLIAGSKDWKNSLDTEASDNVKFLGFVSESMLISLYKNANAFVFVSYEEGFGLPPLEAMTYNVPVIVSSTSCFPEVCGDAPIYVDPDNPKEIAEKINLICSSAELRNNMIAKGKKIISNYTWEKHVKKLITILRQ